MSVSDLLNDYTVLEKMMIGLHLQQLSGVDMCIKCHCGSRSIINVLQKITNNCSFS